MKVSKKMDIVIVAQYLRNIEDFNGNNSRFVYLAKKLAQNKENKVEIITSNFSHGEKRVFKKAGKLENITITVCKEPGYPKNVCLKRFSSHNKLASNIKEYLDKREKPDVLYVAVPSLSVAEVCADYCRKNKVKFIIDIQDLWPEAFKLVFNVPILSDLLFSKLTFQANKIYKAADEIAAVSETYAKRALKVNSKVLNAAVVYLGTDKEYFDECAKKELSNEAVSDQILTLLNQPEKVVMAYCGTLGSSYNLSIVFEALKLLDENTLSKLVFIVMGDGSRKNEFMEESEGLPVYFTGFLDYPTMVSLLSRCDFAVNPIAKGAAQSIINKHMDYAMAGLPVINTQECIEYKRLLSKYSAGINCSVEDTNELSNAIFKMVTQNREIMSKNSRKLGENEFDRASTYNKLVNLFDISQ